MNTQYFLFTYLSDTIMNIWFNESQTVEFKESTSLRKDASGDIVAFANTDWWSVFFGIKDDWTIL